MAKTEKVFICPKCGTVGTSEKNNASCFKCGYPSMVPTEYELKRWNELSEQQKREAIEAAEMSLKKDEESNSGLISFLNTIAIIWLIAGLLGAIIIGISLISDGQIGFGLCALIGGSIATVITAGTVMVFLDMAADVRRIRGILEKK